MWRKRKLDYTWEQMHIATPNFWTRARLYYYIVILGRIRYYKYKCWFIYTWIVKCVIDMNYKLFISFFGYRNYWHFIQNWILAYFLKASASNLPKMVFSLSLYNVDIVFANFLWLEYVRCRLEIILYTIEVRNVLQMMLCVH